MCSTELKGHHAVGVDEEMQPARYGCKSSLAVVWMFLVVRSGPTPSGILARGLCSTQGGYLGVINVWKTIDHLIRLIRVGSCKGGPSPSQAGHRVY